MEKGNGFYRYFYRLLQGTQNFYGIPNVQWGTNTEQRCTEHFPGQFYAKFSRSLIKQNKRKRPRIVS